MVSDRMCLYGLGPGLTYSILFVEMWAPLQFNTNLDSPLGIQGLWYSWSFFLVILPGYSENFVVLRVQGKRILFPLSSRI